MPRVFQFVKPFWPLVVLSFATNLVFSGVNALVLAIVEPVFRTLFGVGGTDKGITQVSTVASGFKVWFDDIIYSVVLSDQFFVSIRNLSIMIFCLFVVRGLAKYVGNLISTKLEEGVMKNIRDTLFTKLTELPMAFYSKTKTGSIISLLTNDVAIMNSATINSMTTMWREATTILIYVALLIAISPILTFVSVSISVLGFTFIRTATKLLRRYGARLQKAQAEYTSTLQETVGGVRVVKAMGLEQTMQQKFFAQTSHFVKTAIKNTRVLGLVPVVNDTFGILALVGVFYAGGMQLANGSIEPSSLVTFLFLLFGLMQPITVIVSTIGTMQRGISAAENIVTVLDEKPIVVSGSKKINAFTTAIDVSGLSFIYETSKVLNNVTFRINKGETIALVGASGSGKSTMLDLLLRFYDPQEGSISLDGVDIRELDTVVYRKLFGIVGQETILFNDTAFKNISIGLSSPTYQQVKHAATIAHADAFISNLPDQYETELGDRGMKLSGGQRQRIAIARAVVSEPQILLFDEATSALDSESERVVQGAIAEVLKDRTAVVVAHRLSTIVNADRILVFENGSIVEEGSHNELIELQGTYAKLHSMQFKA